MLRNFMAFDYNSIIPLISSIALLISILSAYYTYYQNQRKMEVDLWIHKHDGTSMVTLCGFNPSYRSLALINFSLIADNKPITILERAHEVKLEKELILAYELVKT